MPRAKSKFSQFSKPSKSTDWIKHEGLGKKGPFENYSRSFRTEEGPVDAIVSLSQVNSAGSSIPHKSTIAVSILHNGEDSAVMRESMNRIAEFIKRELEMTSVKPTTFLKVQFPQRREQSEEGSGEFKFDQLKK